MDMDKVKLFLHVQQSHDGQGVTIGVVFETNTNATTVLL
jgi:hypothetical protein